MQYSKLKFYAFGAIITLVTFFIVASVSFDMDAQIATNIKIQNIAVGDLTKEQALQKLKTQTTRPIIKLSYQNQAYYIEPEAINYRYDYQASINQVYQVGRMPKENLYQRYIDMYYTKQYGRSYQLACNYDERLLNIKIQEIIKQIQIMPQDASIVGSPLQNNLQIEKTGLLVDAYSLYYQILEALHKGQDCEIKIETLDFLPARYTQDLIKFKKLLGRKVFIADQEAIALIVCLDGTIWKSNTSISWIQQLNKIEKSTTASWQEANSQLMLRKFYKLCQQLQLFTERISQDDFGEVIIQKGNLDLVVRNNSRQDIYISCYQEDNKIYLEFWGEN